MIVRHHTNKRMSAIVEYPANATQIVISGQVADDDSGDVRAQTADVLAKIDRYLKEAGSDRSRDQGRSISVGR